MSKLSGVIDESGISSIIVRMTPVERADKICLYCGLTGQERKFIENEIRAAENEALERMAWGNLQAEARGQAYADAISIVNTLLKNCGPNDWQTPALERVVSLLEHRAAELADQSKDPVLRAFEEDGLIQRPEK